MPSAEVLLEMQEISRWCRGVDAQGVDLPRGVCALCDGVVLIDPEHWLCRRHWRERVGIYREQLLEAVRNPLGSRSR